MERELSRAELVQYYHDIITTTVDEFLVEDETTGEWRSKRHEELSQRLINALKHYKVTPNGMVVHLKDKVKASQALGKLEGWEKTNTPSTPPHGIITIGFETP